MDILAMSPAQVVLALINRTLGPIAPQEQYVDFAYANDTTVPADSLVTVTLTGRDKTPLGEAGRWSGTKSISVRRALLKKAGTNISLRIPFVDGMSLDGVFMALAKYHNFLVSPTELVFKLSASVGYSALPTDYKPTVGTLYCKFGPDNLRFDPNGSEFQLELYKDQRADVRLALTRDFVSSVSNAVEG